MFEGPLQSSEQFVKFTVCFDCINVIQQELCNQCKILCSFSEITVMKKWISLQAVLLIFLLNGW